MTDLYISTTGDDANDGLSPSTPFATAQYAYEVAIGIQDSVTFNFASGTYGGIVVHTDFNYSIKGDNSSNTYLGGITNVNSGIYWNYNTYQITVYSDGSISLGTIDTSSGYADYGYSGSISIHNGVFNSDLITSNGPAAGSDNSDGGYAGNISLYNCSGSATIQANGGNASISETSVASGGNGGNIYIRGHSLTYSYSNIGGTGSQAPNGSNGSVDVPFHYNNAQEDGDWGNILNWWLDSGFTAQATSLPANTDEVNLYNQVTQNTQGANQCFCASASFWSANFSYGLTLQSTGVVNMQGSSIMAGHTTDGVSMHDSSTLTDTSVIDADVTMRGGSRAYGYIGGNAYVYYDGGDGQFPIGGIVAGSVTYIGWPAASPQWFNDQATGGANDGDFSNLLNWWSDNTYTTRPTNTGDPQSIPDASTDVFIAPNTGIVANTGTANPTINSVTANDSNIQNISITATNGFLFSGNEGVANAVLYGDVIFQDTAYNDHAVIQGKATYKSAASLQYSWGQNSLGNVNAGMYNGSTAFEVNISSGGGSGNGGFISRLLYLPWFIKV
jgi:hypothetical protein